MKDLLPIGSVVTLKEGTKRLMIIGRLQQNVRTKKVYDYAGCLWQKAIWIRILVTYLIMKILIVFTILDCRI